jgi:hypothetical protein
VNAVMQHLKPLWMGSKYSCKNKDTSREKGFVEIQDDSLLGAGRLTISIGTFMIGRTVRALSLISDSLFLIIFVKQRLADPIVCSNALQAPAVQHWLQQIEPVERLLDAVLHIIHPEMWAANTTAVEKLIKALPNPPSVWPTSYTGMEVIVNRITEAHTDSGGARVFYDHLLSLGSEHDAIFKLDDLHASFQYQAGTYIFLTGRSLTHSVPAWTCGERIVLTHYAKDAVLHRVKIGRPRLPTQLGCWSKFGSRRHFEIQSTPSSSRNSLPARYNSLFQVAGMK